MIDLTPLEVRKKKGDFRKALRGYDPALVDDFLDLVADRLDELVRENMSMTERLSRLEHQVSDNRERERALTDALVTAQEMREEVRQQTAREAELTRRTAEQEAQQIRADAMQAREREEEVLRRLRARQQQLLQSYRTFLAREMAELQVIGETLEIEGMSPIDAPRGTPRGGASDTYAARGSRHAEVPDIATPTPEPVMPSFEAPPVAPKTARKVAATAVPEPVAAAVAAATPEPEPMQQAPEATLDGAMLMGAIELPPLPPLEDEPFAPEPVDDLDDELALSDELPMLSIEEELDRAERETLELDFITTAPDETTTLHEPDADEVAPEIGAPDHDAVVLLENALKAGYRLELDDEDEEGVEGDELLLDDPADADEPPRDWLDRMIDDEER